MTERMKILEMLSEGKISPEQAESLLSAIDTTESRRGLKVLDKVQMSDLKNIGTQISSVVTQSLQDAKRALEGQLDVFSLSSTPSVSITQDLSLPLNIQQLTAETTNGTIQVSAWDEPYVKIHVRAKARTNQVSDGRRALNQAIQVHEDGSHYHLTIVHGQRGNDKDSRHDGQAEIVGASLDIQVPRAFEQMFLRSTSGRIYLDHVYADNVHLETANGSIQVYHSAGARMTLVTENGGIEVVGGVTDTTRQLHANTRNGSIRVEGLPETQRVFGRAQTTFGKVEIDENHLDVVYEDGGKRGVVRFQSAGANPEDNESSEARLQLETRNGSIQVKA